MTHNHLFYIVMGVSGSGKSTVGKLLSDRLGCAFYDGDDFHPLENIAKMNQGIPLTDRDRLPWLKILRRLIEKTLETEAQGVLACSALKQQYRLILQAQDPRVVFIYLQGDYDCLRSRIEKRQGHFMSVDLLASQLTILEEPENALIVDVSLSTEKIVQQVLDNFSDNQLEAGQ